MSDKIQHRGNCPCCGRQQAVLKSGLMSKHGYVVDHGWFNGVCTGQNYAPMQIQREVTDDIIKQVRADVEVLFKRAKDLKEERTFPKTVRGHKRVLVERKWEYEKLPFEQGSIYQKEEAVRSFVFSLEQRAKVGSIFAADLEELVNRVHGQPLIEVKVEPASAYIQAGEKRKNEKGDVYVALYQDGARVYWTMTRSNGQTFKSWTGSRAWRSMEAV